MIDASQISDEVAEAAAKAAYEVERALWDEARRTRRSRHVPSLPVWDNLSDARRRALICMSRAAIAAMRPFIRAEVLEEAADVVGEVGDCAEAGAYIAAIRALKEKP
jgi:hypothetical protein